MEPNKQKAARDLNVAIRDLRGAKMFVARNRFENDDHEIRQTLKFVDEAIHQFTTLKLKS